MDYRTDIITILAHTEEARQELMLRIMCYSFMIYGLAYMMLALLFCPSAVFVGLAFTVMGVIPGLFLSYKKKHTYFTGRAAGYSLFALNCVFVPLMCVMDRAASVLPLVSVGTVMLMASGCRKWIRYSLSALMCLEYILLFCYGKLSAEGYPLMGSLLLSVIMLCFTVRRTIRIYKESLTCVSDELRYLNNSNSSLSDLSNRDQLTGLFNRRHYDNTLASLVSRCPQWSMILCDIDHFKLINDTYGHDAGDIALQKFAESLVSSSRPDDIICRYGGEEIVTFIKKDLKTASELAERMRKNIESMNVPETGPITASFGVAEYVPGMKAEDFFKIVDGMCRKAKDTGRNRVCVAWN